MIEDLPPLPSSHDFSQEACEVIRLYLAVRNDLSAEQERMVSAHLAGCPACARESQLFARSTALIGRLPESAPSVRVDEAVMAAIAAHTHSGYRERNVEPLKTLQLTEGRREPRKRRAALVPTLATIAALLFIVLAPAYFIIMSILNPTSSFNLPQNLSWNGYVLYQIKNGTTSTGEHYQLATYYDLSTGRVHMQANIAGKMDVVLVGDSHSMLGKDMMHHVAEKDPQGWQHPDESLFDLAELRRKLGDGSAVYLGKDRFQGQKVYRILMEKKHVLLLDMQYRPVNVLENVTEHGAGQPMYETLKMMLSGEVEASMWDMSVPTGFTMGKVPELS